MFQEKLLSELIGINSVFPSEQEVALYLENQLQRRGFQVERQYLTPDRFNLVAQFGQGERTVMYYAHMDVVPEYQGWTRQPFALSADEERYYGRGVADMKGGIAAFLSAFDAVKLPNHRVILVLGVDEENISAGGHLFAAQTDIEPDVVFSLEGDALSCRWTHPIILTWGRRGRAAYRLRVPGISAHGATLSEGMNAISEAARLVLALDEMTLPTHTHLPAASQYIRTIAADAGSLSIPDSVELMLDRHLVPPETSASVLNELRQFINGLYRDGTLCTELAERFEIDLMPRETAYLEPFVTSQESAIAQQIVQLVSDRHRDIPAHYGSSVADENVFAHRFSCPVLCVGPVGGNYHGADEWVSKESLEAITETYADFLRNL